eukprot:jgi/Psemu1/292578/fgenesh1_pg.1138_\
MEGPDRLRHEFTAAEGSEEGATAREETMQQGPSALYYNTDANTDANTEPPQSPASPSPSPYNTLVTEGAMMSLSSTEGVRTSPFVGDVDERPGRSGWEHALPAAAMAGFRATSPLSILAKGGEDEGDSSNNRGVDLDLDDLLDGDDHETENTPAENNDTVDTEKPLDATVVQDEEDDNDMDLDTLLDHKDDQASNATGKEDIHAGGDNKETLASDSMLDNENVNDTFTNGDGTKTPEPDALVNGGDNTNDFDIDDDDSKKPLDPSSLADYKKAEKTDVAKIESQATHGDSNTPELGAASDGEDNKACSATVKDNSEAGTNDTLSDGDSTKTLAPDALVNGGSITNNFDVHNDDSKKPFGPNSLLDHKNADTTDVANTESHVTHDDSNTLALGAASDGRTTRGYTSNTSD